MLKISEEALVVLDTRLGRVGKAEAFFQKNPHLINEKVFPASEMGLVTQHSFLDMAVNFGHIHLVKWIQSKGGICSPLHSPSLLLLATSQSNKELCDFLVDKGFDPWQSVSPHPNVSPMAVAVSFGSIDILKQWKKKGVNLKQDPFDKTLYHELFANIHNYNPKSLKEMMEFLLKEKVVFRADSQGLFPIDVVSNHQASYIKMAEQAMQMRQEHLNASTKKMILKNLPASTAKTRTKKM